MMPTHHPSLRRYAATATLLLFAHTPLHAQLSLHDAIRTGLAQSPDAHSTTDQVELQRAQLTQARLRPNPRVYLQSEDLRPWDHTFSFPDNTEDYGYLSQTLEIDGKRAKRVDYAQANLRRSQAESTLALRQIAAGIADAYWAVAATRAAALEWQHQLADFDRLVQYQSDRVDSGATAGVDLLRTQVERDRVALSYAQAQRDQDAASIELARRTASLSAQSAPLSDPLQQERPVAELPLSTAVEQRPDVLAAREALAQARADIRLQHADSVPDPDFFLGYKRNSGANTLYTGLQFDLPLFSRNQGGVALAAAGSQLADDQLAYTRLAAGSQIATAVVTYNREQALVRSTLPGMGDRAARNAAIIADAYRSGGADLLRYLDAERTLIDTRLLAIQTWAEYQRAAVALQLAYGEQP